MAAGDIESFFAGMEKKKNDEMYKTEMMAKGTVTAETAAETETPEMQAGAQKTARIPRQKAGKAQKKEKAGRGNNVQQTIWLSPEARRGIKLMAIDEDRTISEIIEEWYWERAKKHAARQTETVSET